MLLTRLWQTTHSHVFIADCFNLRAISYRHEINVKEKKIESSLHKRIFFAQQYFINVGIFLRIGQRIESGVQLVKHTDDFHGSFGVGINGAVVAEADDSGEQQSNAVESFR